MKTLRAAVIGLIGLLSLAIWAPAAAADYPNRPVRWLIGFSAGGPVDVVARIMSQWLAEHFGQQFVVENRTGSGPAISPPQLRSTRRRTVIRSCSSRPTTPSRP